VLDVPLRGRAYDGDGIEDRVLVYQRVGARLREVAVLRRFRRRPRFTGLKTPLHARIANHESAMEEQIAAVQRPTCIGANFA
jgi:hypothetical protein